MTDEDKQRIITAFNFLSQAASNAAGVGCNEAFFDQVKLHRNVLGKWIQEQVGPAEGAEEK